MYDEPTIYQKKTILENLRENEMVQMQFDISTINNSIRMSKKQYSYLLHLMVTGKSLKLRNMLISMKVKPKF